MKKIFLTVTFLLFLAIDGYSQCCSAGNPLGGDGSQDVISKNELNVFSSFKYSLSTQYYHLNSIYNLSNIDNSYYNYQNFSLTYGLLSRLSVNAELGYFYDKTQLVNINIKEIRITSSGLGDLLCSLRFTLFQTVKPKTKLVLIGGIKIPIGAFHEEIDGATVPISLQPSSGAFKFNAGIFYSRKRADRRIGWNSFLFLETSNTINQGFLVYKYGNLAQFSLAATYALHKKVDMVFNSKFEWREHDKRENEMMIESTGSKVIFINPQLIYAFKPNWNFIIMADLPVYKYVNGYQLTNSFSFQLGIRKKFNFSKS